MSNHRTHTRRPSLEGLKIAPWSQENDAGSKPVRSEGGELSGTHLMRLGIPIPPMYLLLLKFALPASLQTYLRLRMYLRMYRRIYVPPHTSASTSLTLPTSADEPRLACLLQAYLCTSACVPPPYTYVSSQQLGGVVPG